MESFERVKRRLAGESVDRPPNFTIFMTYGAHAAGEPLSAYYQDYRVLCKANAYLIETLGLDIAQAISDPYREAADLGAEIIFPEDGLPFCRQPLLADREDLTNLKSPDPQTGARMRDRLAAVRQMHERYGRSVPVMGWVEGALAEAADLRGVSALMMDLIDAPGFVSDLLAQCVEVEIAFAKAQIEAGADIIGLGDAVASQISPWMYRKWALPYETAIFEAVHDMGALTRLHICGDTTRILTDMVESGADIIDIDWMVPMDEAARVFGQDAAVCGNMDPVSIMLQGTPELVYEATTRCLEAGGPRCFSAAGCEIPVGAPRANLEAQVAALWDFGK